MSTIAGRLGPLYIDQMTDEQIAEVEQRMQPMQWSGVGFLRVGDSLRQVIQEDKEILEMHGMSYASMANQLRSMIEKAEHLASMRIKSWREGISVPCLQNRYVVQISQSKGFQRCPFSLNSDQDCGNYKGSAVVSVTDLETGAIFSFPSLMPHLIEDHKFFERGDYAVKPEAMIHFFNMKERPQPPLKFEDKLVWEDTSQINSCKVDPQRYKRVKEKKEGSYSLTEEVECVFFPERKHLYVANKGQNEADFTDSPVEVSGAWLTDRILPGELLFRKTKVEVPILERDDTIKNIYMAVLNQKNEWVPLATNYH